MNTDSSLSHSPKPCVYDVVRMYHFESPLEDVAAMSCVQETIVEALFSGDMVHRVYARKVLAALSEVTGGLTWTLDNVQVALLPTFHDFHVLYQFDLALLSTTSGVPLETVNMMLRDEPVSIKEATSVLQAASKQTGQNYTMGNVDVQIDGEGDYQTDRDCLLCRKYPSRIFTSKYFFVIDDDFPVRQGRALIRVLGNLSHLLIKNRTEHSIHAQKRTLCPHLDEQDFKLPKTLLILPIRHTEHLTRLTPVEFCDLYIVIQEMSRRSESEFGADGYNLGVESGEAAGQTVSHLSIHFIPRRFGDVLDPRGGIRKFLPNPLKEYPPPG